jgi:hypothetical protein
VLRGPIKRRRAPSLSAPSGAAPYTNEAMIKALAAGKLRFTPEALVDMKASPASWESVASVEGTLFQPVAFEERWHRSRARRPA